VYIFHEGFNQTGIQIAQKVIPAVELSMQISKSEYNQLNKSQNEISVEVTHLKES